ncbi:tRNA(m(1)G37)methyltransferase [Dispira simplex]|nr:tRNA(m(1)G37)methyltransferase [Dispira simplex]
MLKPPVCRNTSQLVREAFATTLKILAIKVAAKQVGPVTKQFEGNLLNLPRLRNVIDTKSADSVKPQKLILLRRDFHQVHDLPREMQQWIVQEGCETCQYTVKLDYDYWPADDILRAILPESLQAPTSFETVGHIAHMNLREEYLPYRHIIGQVILDKARAITTVVNKLDNIDTTFRFFKMEVLAGTPDFVAETRENDCRFRFDFSKVYWNSRLHTEHERLVKSFSPGDYVCDVFAGVGPFALPAAKRGCFVYANDLNPESHRWLQENIQVNKVDKQVLPSNLDGREFIRHAFSDLWKTKGQQFQPYMKPSKRKTMPKEATSAPSASLDSPQFVTFQHVVMNLPATAIEFLDAFKGILHSQKEEIVTHNIPLPFIHVHCFTKDDNPAQDLLGRISQAMGHIIIESMPETRLHFVRKVAPKKDMYCVTFRLPEAVAFSTLKRKANPDTITTES